MVYDNKTTIVKVTVNSLFWTARPAHTLASWDETLKSDHISEPYLALLTTMLFVQHRVSFTLKPVCVKIEITTTMHFSVKDKTCQHTPFSFTVRLISSSRMRVIFIFCGSSPGYLQNLKEIVQYGSTWMSTKIRSQQWNQQRRFLRLKPPLLTLKNTCTNLARFGNHGAMYSKHKCFSSKSDLTKPAMHSSRNWNRKIRNKLTTFRVYWKSLICGLICTEV